MHSIAPTFARLCCKPNGLFYTPRLARTSNQSSMGNLFANTRERRFTAFHVTLRNRVVISAHVCSSGVLGTIAAAVQMHSYRMALPMVLRESPLLITSPNTPYTASLVVGSPAPNMASSFSSLICRWENTRR